MSDPFLAALCFIAGLLIMFVGVLIFLITRPDKEQDGVLEVTRLALRWVVAPLAFSGGAWILHRVMDLLLKGV